ncbi:MAG: DUF2029 domain-containing protein, partial [Candidatus Lokiarchaeota archaeon]|nr:DUF2029 domain-containing protein [Candidatus Lokiarchaeota archaeon]
MEDQHERPRRPIDPNGRETSISSTSLDNHATFKDIQVLISFGSIIASTLLSQALFFPNVDKNFDPDIFIYVYAFFGVITWLAWRRTRRFSINQVMGLFFLTRIGILAFQIACYSAGSFYNEINEVAYYQAPLAAVLVDPGFFSLYQYAKYGMPPMFQFWLLAYNAMIFSNASGFLRDCIFSLFNIGFDFATMYIMIKMVNSGGLERFSRIDGETRQEYFEFGLFFYAISIFNIYYNNVRNFMDAIPICLALAGMLCYRKGNHAVSALLLSISTLMKFIPIFWLLLVVLKFVKQKDFRRAFIYVAVASITAMASFYASALYFDENPLHYFFEFFPQFYKWSRLSGDGIQ